MLSMEVSAAVALVGIHGTPASWVLLVQKSYEVMSGNSKNVNINVQ